MKLRDLCLRITDGSHYSPKDSFAGIPMLSVKDMKENGFDYSDTKFVTPEDYELLKRNDCKPLKNDILIAKDGSYLKHVFVIKEEVDQAILSSIGILRPNLSKVLPDYLKYYLQTDSVKKTVAKKYVSGSALPRIILKNFGEIDIVYKDLSTQQKISSVLSALDDKIELNNKINAELEAMVKILYDYWFVQFDFPNADGKPYKSSGGEMVYDDVLKRKIPQGWEVKKLNTLTSFLSRGISPRYADGNTGIPVLNQKCIRDHGLKYQFQRRHDNVSKSASNRLIEKYDVLVNSTGVGTLGRVALVRWLIENEVTVDSHVTIVRAIPEKINKVFFGYSLLTKQNEIEGFANGSTGQVELSRSQLSDISLLIPLANFQNKFEEFYNPIIETVSINEKQNQELVALRDWLLPMLMNGQVTVKDAYESVEGKLGMVAERKEEYNKILK